MDLSLGNPFPTQQITRDLIAQRFVHRLGAVERIAQRFSREAAAWLASRRLWSPRLPVASAGFHTRLAGELGALQRDMLARTGVHIAIGAASSHVVARTASRLAAASGTQANSAQVMGARTTGGHGVAALVVPRGQERAFLAPLPVDRLEGVPRAALRVLAANGLVTIGELQRVPKAALRAEFGPEEGLRLWRAARGMDS